ncbi:hypothetical protein [Alienimonas sp. DA493]|uniref:hypothetical protein n=1 Tax=Alienimonas sp. DA493 TaxID=3373605 RepID=UPI003755258F
MPRLRKTAFGPGTYPTLSGDAVKVTAEDVRAIADGFAALKADHYSVPLIHEHAPGAENPDGHPVALSDAPARRNDRNLAGWVEGVEVNDDGLLVFEIEAKDDVAADLLEIGTYVSPQFGPWASPTGKRYENVLHHLATTTKPVAKNQSREFEKVVALSEMADGATIRPSEGDEQPAEEVKPPDMAAVRECFETVGVFLDPSVTLSGDLSALCSALKTFAAARGAAGENPGEREGDGPEKEVRPVSMSDVDPADLSRQLTAALKKLDLTPGKSLRGDTELLADLLGRLTEHLRYRERRETYAMSDTQTTPAADDLAEKFAALETKFDALLEKVGGESNPDATLEDKVQAMSDQMGGVVAQNKALRDRVTSNHRAELKARIGRLFDSGRIAKPKREELESVADTWQFSEGDDAVGKALETRLSDFESLPEGAVWDDAQRAENLSVSEQPANPFLSGGEVSDEDADRVFNELHGAD